VNARVLGLLFPIESAVRRAGATIVRIIMLEVMAVTARAVTSRLGPYFMLAGY